MRNRALSLTALTSLLCVALVGAALPVPSTGVDAVDDAGLMAEPGSPCPASAPARSFDVVAIQVPISYNHWGDFDPHGRLFVLAEQEFNIRADIARKLANAGLEAAARAVANPLRAPAELGYQFPTGLSGVPNLDAFDVSDLVQPLVVRAHVGDCVTFNLLNKLPEPASLFVHRAVTPPSAGMALGWGMPDVAYPGESRQYVSYIPDEEAMEGAHFIQSLADPRFQTRHGLFGALVAEPKGTEWHTPQGGPSRSGQEAMIIDPDGSDFREYVLIYHDEIELVDRTLQPLPILSPYGEYGPGTKGMNLRSEPVMNRWKLHDSLGPEGSGELDRGHDKSQYLGSYTYGDPATFIPRAYIGDPSVMRVINAGPGQHHVHHLHGGGIRWRASPVGDETQFDTGLLKDNPILRAQSERQDVQLIGPGESYNLVSEGGAGGVQQSVGDFLFHCHVAEHYIAGMWSIWRVFDTLQDRLAELPDRAGSIPQAVASNLLVGKQMPDGTVLTKSNLVGWLEDKLPPPGVPGPDDASVWDWTTQATARGPVLLGEPEDERVWANYESPEPGERPAILFNPDNGRPAYPMLQPHFGKRPPFANGHGPAPYLGADQSDTNPDGLCPQDARRIDYNIVAMEAPVAYNDHGDEDPLGQIFSLAHHKDAILAGTKNPNQLVIRANQGDCVDVLLSSQLHEAEGDHSKANIHIHLVQFDVQGSDGVITGHNYEQSIRPATTTGTALAAPAAAGDTVLRVADASQLRIGTTIGVGLTEAHVEIHEVTAISGEQVTLAEPLEMAHESAERVGPEFVRYRWFADVELGIVYFHDHVDGLETWRHGLYGALIVEPEGSQWLHPETGEPIDEGPEADIVGSLNCRDFREFVAQVQDRSAAMEDAQGALRDLASLNLRSEPFDRRTNGNPLDPVNGEAATTWEAYPGDDVRVRLLYGANSMSKAVGTFALTGHRFPYEQYLPGSRTMDALSFGISAQHNLRLECGAGGCARLPGDYLAYMTQPEMLERGAWGVLKVHDEPVADLRPLPDTGFQPPGALPSGPVRQYDVVAMQTDVLLNERYELVQPMQIFALADEADLIEGGQQRPQPLVLRASPGELIEVTLTNELDRPVSLSPSLVLVDPSADGVPVDGEQMVAPGDSRTYRWFADRDLGVTYLTSFGDPARDALDGLYGALVIEPEGATFEPATGMSADLVLADGTPVREHVLMYASDDPHFEASVMPYTVDVKGPVSVNYRSEPLADRLGGTMGPFTAGGDETGGLGVHSCQLNNDSCSQGLAAGREIRQEARNPFVHLAFNEAAFGVLETPTLDARQGELMVIRAVGGAGDQLQVQTLAGHSWKVDPDADGSNIVDAYTLGPREVSNAWTVAGQGGAGDYLYGSARLAFLEKGGWGILRVE